MNHTFRLMSELPVISNLCLIQILLRQHFYMLSCMLKPLIREENFIYVENLYLESFQKKLLDTPLIKSKLLVIKQSFEEFFG